MKTFENVYPVCCDRSSVSSSTTVADRKRQARKMNSKQDEAAALEAKAL